VAGPGPETAYYEAAVEVFLGVGGGLGDFCGGEVVFFCVLVVLMMWSVESLDWSRGMAYSTVVDLRILRRELVP
jgi:hypothetical protein